MVVEIEHSSPSRATATIEIQDEERRLVARLDDFECVIDASLNQAFRRNRLSIPDLCRLELSNAGPFTRGTQERDRHRGHRRAIPRQRDALRILG